MLLLLPGLAGHAGEYAALMTELDRPSDTADTHQVRALDPAPGAMGVAEQADAYAAAAGPGPYVVVGHSQGGIVALEMAARRPDAVAGVVVLDAPVLLPRAARRVLGWLLTALPRAMWPGLLRRFMAATFVAADAPDLRAGVLDRLAATDPAVARALVRQTFAFDGERALAALPVPALYVRANIPTPIDRLPSGVAGAELTGVGHWVHVHRPAEVAALLQGFLGRLAARPAAARSDAGEPVSAHDVGEFGVAVGPAADRRAYPEADGQHHERQ